MCATLSSRKSVRGRRKLKNLQRWLQPPSNTPAGSQGTSLVSVSTVTQHHSNNARREFPEESYAACWLIRSQTLSSSSSTRNRKRWHSLALHISPLTPATTAKVDRPTWTFLACFSKSWQELRASVCPLNPGHHKRQRGWMEEKRGADTLRGATADDKRADLFHGRAPARQSREGTSAQSLNLFLPARQERAFKTSCFF